MTKICPFCAEEIQDAAIVCKHCRRDIGPVPALNATPVATYVTTPNAANTDISFSGKYIAIVGILACVLAIVMRHVDGSGWLLFVGSIFTFIGTAVALKGRASNHYGIGFLVALVPLAAFKLVLMNAIPEYEKCIDVMAKQKTIEVRKINASSASDDEKAMKIAYIEQTAEQACKLTKQMCSDDSASSTAGCRALSRNLDGLR